MPIVATPRASDERRARRLTVATLWAVALLPISAQCGAPFETDDPVTVAEGHAELLLFYQSTLEAAGRRGSAPGVEFHLGALEGLEIDAVAALTFSTSSGEGTQWGYGDTTLGLKYQLIPETEFVPLISLVPKFTIPTGNAERGAGNGGSQVFLAASAQKTYESFQTYANAGYWINNGTGNRNYWFVGWQAQYQFSDAWILGAEVFHTTTQMTGQSPSTGFNAGGYYVFNPKSQLLFSACRGLQNATQTNRASAYIGFQLNF